MPDLDDIPGLRTLRAVTLGDPRVRLALLDGPPDLEHDCFSGASIEMVHGDWLPDRPPETEFVEHATAVAGLVFGQPASSVEGIAPRIHGIVVSSGTDAEAGTSELMLARAIETALRHDPDIIHCAFCIPSQTSTIGDILDRALAKATEAEVLVVAPSGNDAGECYCCPADQPSVIAVGGLDDDGSVREVSNYGPAYEGHGVMAWAENLLIATPGGGTTRESGTSGAAPQVSAVAALLLSAARAVGLDPSPLEVGRVILTTARPLGDAQAIGGVLDPESALQELLGDRAPGVEPSLRLPSRLFALGQLHAEPADEASRDRLVDRMAAGDPDDVRALTAHLQIHPGDAALVTWVLGVGGGPLYALDAVGPSAAVVNDRLIEVLVAGEGAPDGVPSIERASIPGVVTVRTVRLRSGQRVPVAVVWTPTGINGWRTSDLARAAAASVGAEGSPQLVSRIVRFLEQVYDAHRNDGVLGRDRALNHAATNAVPAAAAVVRAASMSLELERVHVVKSRFDRPNSECWDIQAWFSDPEDPYRSRRVWVWSVDVADTRPVSVGIPRMWAARSVGGRR